MLKQTPVTFSFIAICSLLFLGTISSGLSLHQDFALFFPQNSNHNSFQYLSSMFLHGGVAHLLFNMLGLWMFGSALEKLWGSQRFIIFYVLCGLGAGLIHTWVSEYRFQDFYQQFTQLGLSASEIQYLLEEGSAPKVGGITREQLSEFYWIYHGATVGASGAIYGVLAAYALCFPNHKLMLIFIPYPISAKYFVPVLLLIDLCSGLTGFSIFGLNIAHFAHVGGALVGGLLTLFVFGRRRSGGMAM